MIFLFISLSINFSMLKLNISYMIMNQQFLLTLNFSHYTKYVLFYDMIKFNFNFILAKVDLKTTMIDFKNLS